MAWLLDTVTVSEFRKKVRAFPAVVAWQTSVAGEETWLSVISLNEIRFGIRLAERKDPGFAEHLRRWYDGVLVTASGPPLLDVDQPIAEEAADLRAKGLSFNDSLIAATAKVHGLTLATRNVKDFRAAGIRVVNPWEFGEG